MPPWRCRPNSARPTSTRPAARMPNCASALSSCFGLTTTPGSSLSPPRPPAQTARQWCPLPPSEKPGDIIGHYKIREKLGEGGCGVVYVAEQTEPVRRRVALKVIKLGMDTRSVIARFEAERQALAMMDHPNIARVLDAGATETGRPYFVMELVRGIKITDYCDQNQLDTTQRLALVYPGLPRGPTRPSKGHHSPRHQTLEHPGHAA